MNFWAKPIVDILIEIAPNEKIAAVSDMIENSGFIKMSESDDRDGYTAAKTEFVKKYTTEAKRLYGKRIFHSHS